MKLKNFCRLNHTCKLEKDKQEKETPPLQLGETNIDHKFVSTVSKKFLESNHCNYVSFYPKYKVLSLFSLLASILTVNHVSDIMALIGLCVVFNVWKKEHHFLNFRTAFVKFKVSSSIWKSFFLFFSLLVSWIGKTTQTTQEDKILKIDKVNFSLHRLVPQFLVTRFFFFFIWIAMTRYFYLKRNKNSNYQILISLHGNWYYI